MDDYPRHLAPELEASGAIKTPFEEWWLRVRGDFATVPENVARYWLHEHWGHSPYSYLPSRLYQFRLIDWPSIDLWKIRSCWCDFDPDNRQCAEHGKYLETLASLPYGYRTAAYMLEHNTFPAPIIIIDNSDGYWAPPNVSDWRSIPVGFCLIEGHRRFNLALHLQRTARLNLSVPIWLMTRI